MPLYQMANYRSCPIAVSRDEPTCLGTGGRLSWDGLPLFGACCLLVRRSIRANMGTRVRAAALAWRECQRPCGQGPSSPRDNRRRTNLPSGLGPGLFRRGARSQIVLPRRACGDSRERLRAWRGVPEQESRRFSMSATTPQVATPAANSIFSKPRYLHIFYMCLT